METLCTHTARINGPACEKEEEKSLDCELPISNRNASLDKAAFIVGDELRPLGQGFKATPAARFAGLGPRNNAVCDNTTSNKFRGAAICNFPCRPTQPPSISIMTANNFPSLESLGDKFQ